MAPASDISIDISLTIHDHDTPLQHSQTPRGGLTKRHLSIYYPSPSGEGRLHWGPRGVGPPRRQIADKRAGFEEPDPGALATFRGGARGVLLHRPGCTKPTRAARVNLGTVPTLGLESAPAALGSHSMGCSGERSWMIAIQWSRQGGNPAQSEDDRLSCVLCPYRCWDFWDMGVPDI